MKKINRIISAIGATALILGLALGSTANAQCTTSTLNISSGYDPIAGGPVVPSNTQLDPMWTSTVSPDAAAAILANGDLIGCYDALPLVPPTWPAPFPGTTWMMGQNNWGVMTDGNPAHTFTCTYERKFTVCGSDSINFEIQRLMSDDWISDIYLDGSVIQSYPVSGGVNVYPSVTLSLGLLSGTHSIQILVHNFNNGVYLNAIGVDIQAQLVSVTGSSSLVSEICPEYSCDDKCDDKCFWKLTGNNIYGTNNRLGTLSNDDIRIISSATQRAVVKSSGEIGIRQLAPTTTFNVDCIPPGLVPSGLRFENLPYGQGNILVVDALGYVYQMQGGTVNPANPAALQQEVDALKKEVAELKALIKGEAGTGNTHKASTMSVSPNPSSGDINVSYAIVGSFTKAVVRVSDNMGREVITAPVPDNNGIVHITLPSSLKATTLVATLIVDGAQISASQISYMVK